MVSSTDANGSLNVVGAPAKLPSYQNVVVMRHGDRIDNSAPLWAASASRPWDPPLDNNGKLRAFRTGEKFREQLDFPIHRAFVSPFLRCLETAAQVVTALCAVASSSDDPRDLSSNSVALDPSKIKVSIEYGLSEMLNSIAIRETVALEDWKFTFDISQSEVVLPAGTIDGTVESVYKEFAKSGHTKMSGNAIMITCTITFVLFSTVVFGLLTKHFIRLLFPPSNSHDSNEPPSSPTSITLPLLRSEQQLEDGDTINIPRSSSF